MPATLSAVEEAPARAGVACVSPTINDLAIRVGTVNGSGSQSANLVILRTCTRWEFRAAARMFSPRTSRDCLRGFTSEQAARDTLGISSTRKFSCA